MKQFFLSLCLVAEVIFQTASAQTLVELCQNVCTNAGDYLNRYQADMPECAQKFLNERDYFGKQWACKDVKKFVLDLTQRAAESQDEGKEDEFGDCVKETIVNIFTAESIEEFRGDANDECRQKFYSILSDVAREVGEI